MGRLMKGMFISVGIALLALSSTSASAQGASPNPTTNDSSGDGTRSEGATDWQTVEAQAKAQTAAYNAQTAMYQAQMAALAAKYGAAPTGADWIGKVDLPADKKAGEPEAAILVERSVNKVAWDIFRGTYHAIAPRPHQKLLVVNGQSDLSLNDAMQFDMAVAEAKQAMAAARSAYAHAVQNDPPDTDDNDEEDSTDRAAIPIAAAMLDGIAKIASNFQTSYAFGPIATTDFKASSVLYAFIRYAHSEECRTLLDPRVLAEKPENYSCRISNTIIIPDLQIVANTALIEEKLGDLSQQHTILLGEQAAAKLRFAELTSAGKSGIAAHYSAADTAANHATSRYNTLTQLLSAAAPANAPSYVARVARQYATREALKNNALVLSIDSSSSAQYYTKKNMWTFFGGPPLYVAGVVKTQFALIDSQSGAILAAGSSARHGGYHSVKSVEQLSP